MFKRKMKNLKYAVNGLRIAWREEMSFRVQVGWGVATIALAALLRFSAMEFLLVFFMIGFVLAAEALNTALEELCDKFQPEHDPHIAKIKDLAAAAVLMAAITAFVVGCILFIPHILEYV